MQTHPQDNFLLLRLIAAALVIYGHAPAITGGGPVDLFVWLGNAALSLPLAFACGVLSWHAIEKPALGLRDAPARLWQRVRRAASGNR